MPRRQGQRGGGGAAARGWWGAVTFCLSGAYEDTGFAAAIAARPRSPNNI